MPNLDSQEEKNSRNILNTVVGIAVLFGTVWLISKAWKKGQK